jgi:hypothetical protein
MPKEQSNVTKKLTLDEVKKRTMELLETSNAEDVAYITQAMVDANDTATEDGVSSAVNYKSPRSGVLLTTLWGHNMRYGQRNGRDVYVYERADGPANEANACGEVTKYIYWDSWDHHSTNLRCSHGSVNHSLKTRFVSRSG